VTLKIFPYSGPVAARLSLPDGPFAGGSWRDPGATGQFAVDMGDAFDLAGGLSDGL